MRFAVIGAGISGISLARKLFDNGLDVDIFEGKNKIGGLISCSIEDGNLFHRVGGHVFNSKDKVVSDWFWSYFNKFEEFTQSKRNAKILLENKIVGYPIENFIFQLNKDTATGIIEELINLSKVNFKIDQAKNFGEFLLKSFGKTLYELYFEPYNKKIWNTPLESIDLDWLDGKLPMPNFTEIIINNILRLQENDMVHSNFFYPIKGGSQFIIDRLAQGLNIKLSTPVDKLVFKDKKLIINEKDEYDCVIYTADVRGLGERLHGLANESFEFSRLKSLRSNGTSNVLCYTDTTDISWLYLPNPNLKAHRIIYTGNFSSENNKYGERRSCTVEFSGFVPEAIIKKEIKKLPGNLEHLAFNYEPNSYVIQDNETRKMISALKSSLKSYNIYLVGRFAEWEYYNMDKAIEASLKLYDEILDRYTL
ncbi:MAG: FAD-dependent oxidoreductase [Ignavibacteriae bacterium]|nr:FAD-dependent oxidoreductase [Ignavibacteriota bacterium]